MSSSAGALPQRQQPHSTCKWQTDILFLQKHFHVTKHTLRIACERVPLAASVTPTSAGLTQIPNTDICICSLSLSSRIHSRNNWASQKWASSAGKQQNPIQMSQLGQQ